MHFPLHPETPAEGRSLADLFAGRNVDRKAMHAQMKARMDAEGLPYGERTMTYNSRLAQELGKWADTQPGGEAIHDALFRAYFVEARDISQPEVLLEIAEQVGSRARPPARCWRSGLQGGGRRGLGALARVRHHGRADVRRGPTSASSAPSRTRRWRSSSRRRRRAAGRRGVASTVSARRVDSRATGLDPILGAIARTAAGLCEANDALIRLVEGDHHRLAAKYGSLGHFQRLGDTQAIRRDTPLGLAVLERRPSVATSAWPCVHASGGWCSCACTPVGFARSSSCRC